MRRRWDKDSKRSILHICSFFEGVEVGAGVLASSKVEVGGEGLRRALEFAKERFNSLRAGFAVVGFGVFGGEAERLD